MMRHEVENAVAKAKYVWWDMESCSVPDGCNPNEIRWNIESALVKCYGPGPLTIFAIGNSRRVPPHVLEAMSRSGIIINHTHIGGHSVATNLCSWVSNHSPPAILMLISDRESAFQNLLVRYEALGYTIARAYLNPPPESLKYNCNVWLWKSLLTQEETTRQELHGKWKCNETFWRCRLCFIDGQGFEDFTSHLDSGEHALKEFLLLPHSDFMEEPYKGGLPDLRLLKEMKFPDPKNLRIGWDVRRKEKKAGVLPNKGGEDALKGGEDAPKDPVKQALLIKWEKQYKAGMLPHKGGKDALKDPVKQESDMVSPDCAAGHNEKDASLDFVKNQSKAATLPNKGGEDAPKDPVKQELRIAWAERRKEKKQLKAGMLPHKGGEDALKESHMVSPDCAAGHNEKDASLDFVKNQSKAGTLPNKGGEDAPKELPLAVKENDTKV